MSISYTFAAALIVEFTAEMPAVLFQRYFVIQYVAIHILLLV